MPTFEPGCGSGDHDGAHVPVERAVQVVVNGRTRTYFRCAYCAEALAARLMRDGYAVSITPITTAGV